MNALPLKKALLVLSILLFQCKEDAVRMINCRDEFDINESETLEINCPDSDESYNGTNFKIKLLDIRDSRCCAACFCISAGFVEGDFLVIHQEKKDTLKLRIGQSDTGYDKKDSVDFSVNNKKLRLILKDVTPFPVQPEDNMKNKIARLQLKAQTN